MLFSLIIPVYNAEKYLAKCLDSVKNQTYGDLEIILVNDGSTDRSGLICDEYCRNDDRFIVIHKENGGVSSARNMGLKKATGQHIGFVDPDDWIEPNMFERLYQLLADNQVDILICGYFKESFNSTSHNKIMEQIIKLDGKKALNSILDPNGFKGFTCNKLFSSELIRRNNISFDEEIHFCEDLLFCCQAFLSSKNIIYDTTPYYHYIIHDRNVSQSQFSLKKMTSLIALENTINILSEEDGITLNKFINYYEHMNISLLMNGIKEKKINKEIRKKLKGNLFRYKIKDLTNNFVKLSCILSRININLYYVIWRNLKGISTKS